MPAYERHVMIGIPPELQEAMDADPELAKEVRSQIASMKERLHQALEGVDPFDDDTIREIVASVGGKEIRPADKEELARALESVKKGFSH